MYFQNAPDFHRSEPSVSFNQENHSLHNQIQYTGDPQYYPIFSTEYYNYADNDIKGGNNFHQSVFNLQNHIHQNYAIPSYPRNNNQNTALTSTVSSLPEYPPTVNNIDTERHCARITITQSKNGLHNVIVKHKCKRTVFRTDQIKTLEKVFQKNHYIRRKERLVIAEQLHLSDKVIKIWFQNRRLKERKSQDIAKEEANFNNTPAKVERYVSDRTQCDNVGIDNNLIEDLLNFGDDAILNNEENLRDEDVTQTYNSPIYEPISPASTIDSKESSDENISSFLSTPEDSLRILFDLQAMMAL